MTATFTTSSAGIAGDPDKLMYATVYDDQGNKIEKSVLYNASPVFFKGWHYRRAQRKLLKILKKYIQTI